MKPAPIPTRAPGETLKYASAAAAAAASDKSAVGIAPLPPPPSAAVPSPAATNAGLSANPPTSATSTSATTSPSVAPSLPTSVGHTPAQRPAIPASTENDHPPNSLVQPASPTSIHTKAASRPDRTANPTPPSAAVDETALSETSKPSSPPQQTAILPSRTKEEDPQPPTRATKQPSTQKDGQDQNKPDEDESVYHLPPGLQDLIHSYEATKNHTMSTPSPSVQRLLGASHATCPDYLDAEKPRHYRPQTKYNTPRYYPQEPFMMIDDPSLYSKIDTDTLFYIFYYRQNTYQQYMAAKSLKSQSWRFHKQYQTWFQRHEEPKTITEEYEQGTYRFFDYESTWCVKIILACGHENRSNHVHYITFTNTFVSFNRMNRRKADFKFAYKFLEDDL